MLRVSAGRTEKEADQAEGEGELWYSYNKGLSQSIESSGAGRAIKRHSKLGKSYVFLLYIVSDQKCLRELFPLIPHHLLPSIILFSYQSNLHHDSNTYKQWSASNKY